MKTKRCATWGFLAGAVACAAVVALPGCELLVSFDRSKIPEADASVGDDATVSPDAPASSEAASDGSPPQREAGPDATSPADAALDGDASPPPDTGTSDTGTSDTGASDTGADAPNEVGPGPDAGVDSGN